MGNIGYAVFGMPRGIAVISNGLFKSLNLDKSLYLNSAHVVLEKGEQVLMIRRIPSNLNNLEQKDALLIALYENALQHSENRAGGFVGSAICFKDKMPNAEEMISGLMYLFSKMKENVDADNRFKAIDSSNWNTNLPDANKKYGLEDSKLNYSPSSSSTSKNVVLKLNSFNKEAASLLYNFVLNRSFHSVDYLYASTSNTVVDKLKSKGFLQIPFAELFNYNRYLNYFKDRLDKDDQRLKLVHKKQAELEKRIAEDNNQLIKLESTIAASKTELDRINKEITKAKQLLAQGAKKSKGLPRNFNNQNSRNTNYGSVLGNEDRNNFDKLKTTIHTASSIIQEHTGKPEGQPSNSEYDQKIVLNYLENLPKRRQLRLIIFSSLLVLVFTFGGLFIYKTIQFNNSEDQIAECEKNLNDIENDNKLAEDQRAKEFLYNLKNYQKDDIPSSHKDFRKLTDRLLENFMASKYDKNSDEHKFIVDHKWEFWEFDYMNKHLVNKLNPSSASTYFIILDNRIKPLKPQIKWKGEDKLNEQLEDYLKEDNDIYENLNKDLLEDSEIMMDHFKWLIEKENGKLVKLNKGAKIKLPFFDTKNK